MLPHPPTTCTPKLLTSSLSALVTSSVVLLGPNPNCLLIRCSHPRRHHHHHSIHIESTTIQQDRKSIPLPISMYVLNAPQFNVLCSIYLRYYYYRLIIAIVFMLYGVIMRG